MPSSVASFLSKVEPFKRLASPELESLAARCQEITHVKSEHVFTEGENAQNMWVLKSGRLEIFKYNSDGKPRAIESISPGGLYGTLCRIGCENREYPCTAVASKTSVSVRIPDQAFQDIFNRSPAIVTGICLLCSEKLNVMQELTNSSQEPVKTRIIKTLIDLVKTNGQTLPFTKRQIAEFAGTTVETTIRTLSSFQKKKWISSTRGRIIIKDAEKLESLLN